MKWKEFNKYIAAGNGGRTMRAFKISLDHLVKTLGVAVHKLRNQHLKWNNKPGDV